MQFWQSPLPFPQSTLLITDNLFIIYPTCIYNTFKSSTSVTTQCLMNPGHEAQSLGSPGDAMVPKKTCLGLEVYEPRRKIMGTTCAALITQCRDKIAAIRPCSIQEGKGRGSQLAHRKSTHRNQNSYRRKEGPGSALQSVFAFLLSFWDIPC